MSLLSHSVSTRTFGKRQKKSGLRGKLPFKEDKMTSITVKDELRDDARRLRSLGLSYREIQKEVRASLDTLHRWCKDIPSEQTNERTLKTHSEVSNKPFGDLSTPPEETNTKDQTSPPKRGYGSLGLLLLLLFIALALLVYLFKDRITGLGKEEGKESGPELIGYDGRTLEDL